MKLFKLERAQASRSPKRSPIATVDLRPPRELSAGEQPVVELKDLRPADAYQSQGLFRCAKVRASTLTTSKPG